MEEIQVFVHFVKRGRKSQRAAMAREMAACGMIGAQVDNHLVVFGAMAQDKVMAARNIAALSEDVAACHGLRVARVEFAQLDKGWGYTIAAA